MSAIALNEWDLALAACLFFTGRAALFATNLYFSV